LLYGLNVNLKLKKESEKMFKGVKILGVRFSKMRHGMAFDAEGEAKAIAEIEKELEAEDAANKAEEEQVSK